MLLGFPRVQGLSVWSCLLLLESVSARPLALAQTGPYSPHEFEIGAATEVSGWMQCTAVEFRPLLSMHRHQHSFAVTRDSIRLYLYPQRVSKICDYLMYPFENVVSFSCQMLKVPLTQLQANIEFLRSTSSIGLFY